MIFATSALFVSINVMRVKIKGVKGLIKQKFNIFADGKNNYKL